MIDYTAKTYVKPGETVRMEVAFSECAMHMQVAGTVMDVQLLDRQYPLAQLYRNGQKYSAPITTGEAGFYRDSEGYYYYPVK